MSLRILFAAAALATAGCRQAPPAPPPGPPEAACDDAGRTLQRLECRRDDGTPRGQTPAGAPFSDACRAALRDGRNWHPHCIAKMTACSELDCAFRGACCGGS
jgi:hypothetical protein